MKQALDADAVSISLLELTATMMTDVLHNKMQGKFKLKVAIQNDGLVADDAFNKCRAKSLPVAHVLET